jgi:hypothetical protein
MNLDNIFVESDCFLKLDSTKKILYMSNSSSEYNEQVFYDFLEHFTSFWKVVKNSNDKYHVLLDLSEDKTNFLPLKTYKFLITSLNSISDILNKNMHSMCILINKSGFTGSVIKILFNLYKPDRPITYTTDINEAYSFFDSNKLDL